MGKRDIPLQDKLAFYLLKATNKAIRDYAMIADGDHIAVAVSGGKDSLTLLHLLRLRQRSVPERYRLTAVHVTTPEASCGRSETRDELERYLQAQAQAYVIEVIEEATQLDCARCSYLRRKAILEAAYRLGCNKVALGHHADDAAQTTLLNLVFSGRIETLSPRREFFDGLLVLIRPMIYVEEKEVARFARTGAFPPVPSRCPREAASRRTLMKRMIRQLEHAYPKVKINLFRAGLQRPAGDENSQHGRV